jgi:hypothetical protein
MNPAFSDRRQRRVSNGTIRAPSADARAAADTESGSPKLQDNPLPNTCGE